MNIKKNLIVLSLIGTSVGVFGAAGGSHSISDLAGNWESVVEVGKLKIRLITKISKEPDGKITGKIDVPDQGAKDIPIAAMLCNYPAVRFEIDQIGTAFNGKLNAEGTEIAGAFEEGPGGKPMAVVFKRAQVKEEPKRVYTFASGETRDLRGYWQGLIDSPPGNKSRLGLKIGRAPDGSFGVLLDLLDQGGRELPASSVVSTNSGYRLEWQFAQITFEGKLNAEASRFNGNWKQGGRSSAVEFERLESPATVLPTNLSFVPDPQSPADIRGYWKGTLQVPVNKLGLMFKIGKTPDGMLAGSLVSIDQGGVELPMSSGSVTNLAVKLEWKNLHGTFKGALNKDGTIMDGTWEQGGPPLTLKMERAAPPESSGTR